LIGGNATFFDGDRTIVPDSHLWIIGTINRSQRRCINCSAIVGQLGLIVIANFKDFLPIDRPIALTQFPHLTAYGDSIW
jgi:hypothetical protein